MIIKSVHINSFGTLKNFDADFSSGLNVIEGQNESGKTALAMFIKFMFYGLSGRSSDEDTSLTEKKRFICWDTGEASGSLTLETEKGEYRIERQLRASKDASSGTDTYKIIDCATNMPVMKGTSPADAFIGVNEAVFLSTVFVRQLASSRVDGSDVQTAIENMLYSADEKVSTDKALEKLDRERKALLYKNENGGEIYELRRERERLSVELADAQRRGGETLTTEAALSDAKIKLAQLDTELTMLERVSKAYSVISAKEKFDEADAARKKLASLTDAVDTHAISPASREFYSDIVVTDSALTDTEAKLRELDTALSDCEASLNEYESVKLDENGKDTFADYAYGLVTKVKHSVVLLTVMFVFAGLFAAAAYLLPTIADYKPYVLGGAAALAVIGIVFTIRAIANSSKVHAVINEWESGGDIEDAIAAYEASAETKRDLLDTKKSLESEIADAKSTERVLTTKLTTMCSSLGVDDTDRKTAVPKALAVCNEITTEKESARSERDSVTGVLSVLEEQLSVYDRDKLTAEYEAVIETPEGKKALTLSKQSAADAERVRAFKAGALKSQTERTHELETRLSALRAVAPDPSLIQAKLDETSAKLAESEKRLSAYQLAMATIAEATENLRTGILPKITHRACEIMSRLSGGKYATVGVGDDFGMSYSVCGMTREIEYLSAGTRDVAYISLRIALVEVLFKDEPIPAIFDESFARIDGGRLAEMLALLSEKDGQSFVFSCRSLEGEIADNLSGAKTVRLSKLI